MTYTAIPAVSQKPTRRGFTLIELLVVIAIIAILAAILFPVFARARENARRASCQSNVKQIMLGVFQYTQDYDEKFVPAHNEDATVAQLPVAQRSWYNNLQPYLRSTQIYRCPSDTNNTNALYATYPVSYIVNANFGSGAAGGISLASVENVATTVYMVDGLKQSDGTTTLPTSTDKTAVSLKLMGYADNAAVSGTDANWGGPSPRHLETAVFGFADGHVKAGRSSAYFGAATTAKGDCLNPAVGCR
jgi:prepilin-type N-terminal cleavage/methylation domain-containing protein/prepilin-type processing-associated H-X9-DG protein